MNYKSTRSDIYVSDLQAVLQGLASDGGLFVDETLSQRPFDWKNCLSLGELGMMEMILHHVLPGFDDMGGHVRDAYKCKFENDRISPVVKCGDDFVMELYHGPTSAFKDVALSMLPHLITKAREQTGMKDEILILTATSGDTGKAALEGFRDVPGTGIVVFYPEGGVSPVQYAQMATQEGNNVRVCALKGNFDDCQRGVKAAFSALSGKNDSGRQLSSANSINIGRLAPQICYYFSAYAQLLSAGEISLGDEMDFVVPTGNFGDILAGYYAKLMGLPVGRLVVAANDNNILSDFINTGVYDTRRPFMRTDSPSMDILVSSNLERLLFLASGCDSAKVKGWMDALSKDGVYTVDKYTLENIQSVFSAGFSTQTECDAACGKVWHEQHYLIDPHTAVAFAVREKLGRSGKKCVVLSTASPYKFPTAVLRSIGGDCSGDEFEQMEKLEKLTGKTIPSNLAGLRSRKVLHKDVIEKTEVIDYVSKVLAGGISR